MATGPEHYRHAERLLGATDNPNLTPASRTRLVAEAQVHATLALAAAAYDGLAEAGGGVGFDPAAYTTAARVEREARAARELAEVGEPA